MAAPEKKQAAPKKSRVGRRWSVFSCGEDEVGVGALDICGKWGYRSIQCGGNGWQDEILNSLGKVAWLFPVTPQSL